MAESRLPVRVVAPVRYERPVVVTGGAGFLGRETVRLLRLGGCTDVRIVDRTPACPGVAPLDLLRDDLVEAFSGAQTVFHLAGCQYHSTLTRNPYDLPFRTANVEGTRRAIEAARRCGVERFLYASSSMVYGLPQTVPMDEDHPCRPIGPYGESKLAAEALVRAANGAGLATVIVRPPPIFGPGRLGAVTRLFDRILAGRTVVMIGDGHNAQDLVSCEDCARLLLLAGQDRSGRPVYNAGSAAVPTMGEWIAAVIADSGSGSRLRAGRADAIKLWLRALEAVRRSPLRREQYEIADRDYALDASAACALGWAPCSTGVDAALATFRWYRASRGVSPPTPGAR